jgi:hypothetical protein
MITSDKKNNDTKPSEDKMKIKNMINMRKLGPGDDTIRLHGDYEQVDLGQNRLETREKREAEGKNRMKK